MGKKRLSIQQKQRIARKHEAYHVDTSGEVLEGLVITRSKNQALVESLDQIRYLCVIRPDIISVVVGDKVLWKKISSTATAGVVESVLPRTSELSRPDRYGHTKIMAANITQMIVVIAPKPEPSALLIDSYLVAAELLNLQVSIVFNKIDLDTENLYATYSEAYAPLCHAFIRTQIQSPNIQALEAILQNQRSIFVGQSGVGKSTLIQLLLPDFADMIATSPLSAIHEFGQHTTSNAFYFHLPFGGAIIDSPGVRSFSLGKVSPQDLLWGFKEFRPFIGKCKFRDCNHSSAVHCAIQDALKNNQISHKRYENYVKMLTQRSF